MPDLLQRGAVFLDGRRHAHMSRPVTYLRGGESVELMATVGRTVFEQQDQFGSIQRSESRDYIFRAQDLVLAGAPATPRAGDRVREQAGEVALLYEVMAPGDEPPFRFLDGERISLRVHTKFIGEEASP